MRDGWVETTLDGIAEYINGYPFKPADLGEVGLPVIRIKQLLDPNEPVDRTETDTPDRCLLRDGDIVFSWSGTLAVRIWNRGPAKLNQHLFRVVEKKNVYKGIIPLILDHAIEELEEKSHGTTMKHITKQTLLPHKVLLPPLPEQKRIVDVISSVDSYIEALQQHLASAKKSRAAVLYEVLTAGGGNWVETTLGEVADVIDPHPSHRAPAVDDNGIPFIGIGDLRNTGDIDFAKARRVSRDILEEHKARYNRSDFLIGLGRVASIGMVVRLPDENTEYVVSPTLAVINAKDVLGQFLFYLLEGPHSQEQFQRFKKGSTRESVGMQILRKIKVHIPPLPEQRRIVEIIKSIDDVLNTTSCALSESKKLRTSLLSDLLSGEHEIPASYDKVIGAA